MPWLHVRKSNNAPWRTKHQSSVSYQKPSLKSQRNVRASEWEVEGAEDSKDTRSRSVEADLQRIWPELHDEELTLDRGDREPGVVEDGEGDDQDGHAFACC